MRYQERKVSELIPYAGNARTHPPEQIDKIAGSIKKFGFINPIIIDAQNGIIAGHGRLEAAKKLKVKKVPCLLVEHLSEAEKNAYIIADNRMALDSGWDEEILKSELAQLQELDFDLADTGFNPDELDILLNGWDGDITETEKDGTTTAGITSTIKVKVNPPDENIAYDAIKQALEEAGIEHELA